MKTTPPRSLVLNMNTHIARWKKKYDDVQKKIDALPESRDHTAEMQEAEQKSKTLSDNASQDFEEGKNERSDFVYQDGMIKIDYDAVAAKKVDKTSKAGRKNPVPDSDHQ